MASKKIKTILKLNLMGGSATPAPPTGPALGQHGVPIMDFVNKYNELTKDQRGESIPAQVTIYEDRSFDIELKTAPVADLIKQALKLKKGSAEPNKDKVGTLTKEQVTQIAEKKMPDLNTNDLNQAIKIIQGTARSMGITTK
ncbi:50S ribosomal protein L11 [Patescibacteria group bacterium]|nr:50S ribosomal protein L11 [Patescibacteria group bacterium]